jgi:hypothetical protein
MTPTKMFEGDLWVLASYAVQMAENAYKNGQAQEREACALIADTSVDYWVKAGYPESAEAREAMTISEYIRDRGQE